MTNNACGWGQEAWRWAAGTCGLAALCTIGFLTPSALADDLPGLPTTSLPTLPTTLPPPLGTTTAATTTGPSGGATPPPAPASGSSTSSAAPTTAATPTTAPPVSTQSSEPTAPEGVIRLSSGLVSIPVGLVREPVVLGIERLVLRPASRPQGRWVEATFRVWDSRGYVVRAADVDVRSVPAGMLSTTQPQATSTDGVVSLRLKPTRRLLMSERSRLSVVVRAYDPSSVRGGGIAARRVFVLRLSPTW